MGNADIHDYDCPYPEGCTCGLGTDRPRPKFNRPMPETRFPEEVIDSCRKLLDDQRKKSANEHAENLLIAAEGLRAARDLHHMKLGDMLISLGEHLNRMERTK